MELQQSRVDVIEKVTWKIENFSRLNNEKLYSEPVILGGYPWRILLYPRGNKKRGDKANKKGKKKRGDKEEYFSIYLDAVESANMRAGWSRVMTYRLFVFNQVDANMTIRRECNHEFNAKEIDWGFTSFMPLAKFRDPIGGFLVNDACIVGVEVSVHKSRHENQVNQAASLIVSLKSEGHKEVEIPRPEPVSKLSDLELFSASVGELIDFRGLRQIEKAFVPLEIPRPEPASKLTDLELFSASIGELMDFMGLGQIEKAFVPLLEKVCSQHPSLASLLNGRSRLWAEFYTSLILERRKI